MESTSLPRQLARLNSALRCVLVALAISAGTAGYAAFRESSAFDAWTTLAARVLPLETWSLGSSYPVATAAYLSFAWAIYPVSAVLTFRQSLYPPVGSLGLPYTLKQRLLLPWAAIFFLGLSIGGVIAFRGQDTRYIHFGTDVLQLVFLGWTYPLIAGVLAGMSGVILWKSLSGR